MDHSRTREKSPPGGRTQQFEFTVDPPIEAAVEKSVDADGRSSVVRLDLWQLSVIAVALFGIFLRWWDLGWRPLQPDEATFALESLSVVRGEGSRSDVSPLLLNGSALLTLMFGASDSVVRALPALAGSVLVLLPLWLKTELGKTGTLMSMLFLAISPTIIFATRHATPEALTATAGLTVVICATHYLDCRNRSAIYIGAAALALMMASGYPAYSYLLVFAALAAAIYLGGRKRRPEDNAAANAEVNSANTNVVDARRVASEGRFFGQAGLLAAAVFTIVATGALTNLRVIQAGLAGPLGEWLSGFGSANLGTIGTQIAALFAYEGVMVVAALLGAIFILGDRNRFDRILVLWMVIGTLIGVIGGAEHKLALVAGLVPAGLLAGSACGRLLDRLQGSRQLINFVAVALSLLILSVPGYVSITFTSFLANNAGNRTWALIFLTSILVMITIGFTLSGFVHGWSVTSKSFAIVGLVAGLLFTFRIATNLNLQPVANHNELLTPVVTSPDVRRLMYDFGVVVDVLSINRAPRSVQVDSEVGPVLRWYMRDAENVSFVSGPTGSPAIYIGDPSTKPPPGGAYVSQRYRVASSGYLRITRPEELLRWLMFREASKNPINSDAVIFAKTQ